MAKFTIYSSDGQAVRYTGSPRYNGTYLKVSFLDFGSVNSPTKIPWAVGDYVDYTRTGLRYRLYNLPQPKKQARGSASGESFTYPDVQLHEKTKDLEIAPFRDFVFADNQIHFSTLNTVSTYENVYGIVNRIQACLDDLYPNEWVVRVFDGLDSDFVELISESQNFSVTGSVMDACNRLYDIWGIGWIHTVENGKDVLTFGRPNKRGDANTTNTFIYGAGNGLTAIRKSAANLDELATRLYAYGSTRNMLSRYYNGLDIKDAESVDIEHLMIPLSHWGITDGKRDPKKAYLESNAAVLKYGLIPKIVYFDGTDDYPEIYPSLEGVTIADVRSVMQSSDQYYPKTTVYSGAERVDQVKGVENPTDSGKESGNTGARYIQSATADGPVKAADTISFYGSVNKDYTLFSGVSFAQGDILKVEGGQTGYIDDNTPLIAALNTKLIVSFGGEEVQFPVTWRKTNNRYYFEIPDFQLKFTQNASISCVLRLSIASNRSEQSTVYCTLNAFTYRMGTVYELTNTFKVYVRQLGFDINQQATLSSEGKCSLLMKTGMCAARQFTIKGADYRASTDDWVLTVNRTIDDDLGEKFPNTNYPIAIGDEFVLVDLAMPDIYIRLAEQKLYTKATELFNDINRLKPFYEPEIDAKKMAASGWTLKEGMYMHLQDTDIVDTNAQGNEYILIDTLTITEGEAEIPTYKVTLREEKRKSFQQTTTEAISDLKTSTQVAIHNNTEYANRAGSADYASRAGDADKWAGRAFSEVLDQSVREQDAVKFQKVTTPTVVSPDYAEGAMGAGFKIADDNNGNKTLEIDNIIVRKAMKVFELIIQQIKHQGGIVFYSAASMECNKVETVTGGYKCYFDTKEGQVPNEFAVGDQARCQRFNLGTTQQKYYWRLVTAVGDDYIILSDSDCDTGSGVPAAGDVIVQCGNRTNAQRQAVKVTTCMGDNTPRDEYYKNVNSYNLSGKLVTVVGVKDGVVGVFTNQGRFEGQVVIGSGSTGLTNLSEWAEQSQRISDAWAEAQQALNDAAAAQGTADRALETIEHYIDQVNDDSVFDLTEKNLIRKEWININGIKSTMRGSKKGSYYLTKYNFDQAAFTGEDTVFVFNNVEYTYNQKKLVYKVVGIVALDAAYRELRDYLNSVELNNESEVFRGFDRDKLANLLTNYYDAEQRIRDIAQQTLDTKIDDTKAQLQAELTTYQAAVTNAIADLQDQIDGVIDTWFYAYAPTTSNLPASDWTTEALRKEHIGDLFYNTDTGKAYRWIKDSTTNQYYWQELQDDATARALALAQEAKDVADSKRRVFYRQPYDSEAYDPGDLWVGATYGTTYADDILRAQTAKAAGAAFNISHWVKASKYTDDTVALDAKTRAQNAQAAADAAATAAQNAATAASNAANAANQANTKLSTWADDNIINPNEKEALRQQWKDVQTEKVEVCAEAAKYEAYITDYATKVAAYVAAYNAANLAFQKYTAATPDEIAIESDYANISLYYDARVLIADIIAKAAKDMADEALANAQSAWDEAYAAQQTANEAKGLAETAMESIAQIDADNILTAKEKGAIRTEWVSINGIESTGVEGITGRYYRAKQSLSDAGFNTKTIFKYRGSIGYTYNGVGLTYNCIGIANLTAAYLDLRAYLQEIELNDRNRAYGDFNRDKYSTLLQRYYDAEAIVTSKKSDAAMEFINDEYKDDIEELKNQIDGKAETFVQSSDPSVDWTTDDLKKEHLGDMWLNTSAETVSGIGSMKTAIYEVHDNVYGWVQKNIPNDLFDQIDGKASVYIELPTNYQERDLWIILSTIDPAFYPTGCTAGDLCVATEPSTTFNKSHWKKYVKYTDDSSLEDFLEDYQDDLAEIEAQIDGKADTFYGPSSPLPHEEYMNVPNNVTYNLWVGDLWFNTTVGRSYRYTKTPASGSNFNYTWAEVDGVPQDVFDQIDGKSSVYLVLPTYYQARDIWIIRDTIAAANIPNGCTVGDLAVATTASQTFNKAHWQKYVKYTDDSSLDNFLEDYADDLANIETQIDGKADTFYQEASPHSEYTNVADNPSYNLWVGDLWHKPSVNKTYRYCKTLVNGRYNYQWKEMDGVPQSVFDQIDGIASIYVTIPSSPNVGDILMPTNNITSGGRTYYAGRIYKWTGTSWTEADYVDNDEFTEQIGLINEVLNGFATDGQIDASEKRTLSKVLEDETQSRLDLVARATPYLNETVTVNGTTQTVALFLDAFNKAYSTTSGQSGFPGMKEVIEYYCGQSGNVNIVTSYPLSKITTFYEKRNYLIQAIDKAEKGLIDSKDNTQTTIDGGIITSGTIQLRGSDNVVNVGMTADNKSGTSAGSDQGESVRIWAGSTKANRDTAPFRVQQNGKMIATGAEVDESLLTDVTIKGSLSSPLVLWRTQDIEVSGYQNPKRVFRRYPSGDQKVQNPNNTSSYVWFYAFRCDYQYQSGSNYYWSYNTIYTKNTSPYGGMAYYAVASYSAPQEGVITKVTAVNVFNGNANGVGKHDNVVLPQIPGSSASGAYSEETITPEQFSWGAENSGRFVRLVNYKWANTEPDGYITLNAPSGMYFYECGYQTSSIRLSREYVELFGYGNGDIFYGWIVTNRQDVRTRGEYGMPWKIMFQGIVTPQLSSTPVERLWSAYLDINGGSEQNWGYQKLAAGHYKIWLPREIEKYNPFQGVYTYEDNWEVILVPRSCKMNGTTPIASGEITCGYACLAKKGHEYTSGIGYRSYFEVKTADDASLNDLAFDFYVISMANWVSPQY